VCVCVYVQALKDGQDQLKVDQAQLAADQEELRVAHEAAQKEIADGVRVEALRVSLGTKEEQLNALERDLRSQEVQVQSQWQGLRDRQEFLSGELEIACGDVKHDKAVLLKELRMTLTENVFLTEKLAQLEANITSEGGREAQTESAEREGNMVSAGAENRDLVSARSSRTSSSGSIPVAALSDLPSLSLGDRDKGGAPDDTQETGVANQDSKSEQVEA
jgi:hypothetical protein